MYHLTPGADKNVELVFILCSINCSPYLITYLMLFKSLLGLFAQESFRKFGVRWKNLGCSISLGMHGYCLQEKQI